MNKRGLSDVVTTVIIVALSLVAIAVVWIVIQNLISNNTESISSSADFLKLNFKFQSTKNDSGNLFVVVKRNAGDGNFNAINFIVIYKNSSSESFAENGSFEILETKGYSLPISGSFNDLSKIEGYPAVVDNSGKLTVSSMHFDYNLEGIAFSPATVQSDLNNGLVLYLPFNSGEELIDKSGNGNNAVNEGATWVSDGKIGGAYGFDGVDDFISLNSNYDFSDATFSVWINSQNTNSDINTIFSNTYSGCNNTLNNYGFALFINSWTTNDRKIVWEYTPNSEGCGGIISNQMILPSQWYQITFTIKEDYVKIYLNGNLIDNFSVNKEGTSSNNLVIGKFPDNYFYYAGLMDEVRVYNRALSEEEIQELYQIN